MLHPWPETGRKVAVAIEFIFLPSKAGERASLLRVGAKYGVVHRACAYPQRITSVGRILVAPGITGGYAEEQYETQGGQNGGTYSPSSTRMVWTEHDSPALAILILSERW